MKFTEMPYERLEKEDTINELKALIAEAKAAGSGEKLFGVHKKQYAFTKRVTTVITIAQIRHSINTADEFYEAENDYYDEFLPELTVYQDEYKKVIFNSPFRAYLEDKIGAVAFKNMEISFKAFDESLVPLMQEENALVSEYTKLRASAKIEFNGESVNLAMLGKYCTDNDREIRRAAWKAKNDYFLSVTDKLDEIYDKLVKNRTQQAKMLGYSDYVELGYYRMNRNCYDRAMVENFRRQIKEEFVPYVNEIHKGRKERIGVDELMAWDSSVFFKEGNPVLTVEGDEMMQAAKKMYHELSPETADFIDCMTGNELFDIFTKPNKAPGGYMTWLPDYKMPFIFGNCNGTYDDVGLVTHECGHAFQGYVSGNDEILEHLDITMETAEIHSMSMEYFTYNWMNLFFGERTEDYKLLHKEEAIIFIPYGCMVDEFQHRVYENPEMTPAERKALWHELEKSYRPLLDYGDNDFFTEGGYWQQQLHIYCYPFYYIDYVLASVCAMQFRCRMKEDFSGAWADYLKLCRLSASGFYTDMLPQAGLESPFEDGVIASLCRKLRTI